MSEKINQPTIYASASAGNVPVEMDKVQRALDELSAKPLFDLRDKTEAAVGTMNRTFDSAVRGVSKLRDQLNNNGLVEPRAMKRLEQDIRRLQNLGYDDDKRFAQLIGAASQFGVKSDYVSPEVAAFKAAQEAKAAVVEPYEVGGRFDPYDVAPKPKAVDDPAAHEKKMAAAVDGIRDELLRKEQKRLNTLEGEYDRQRKAFLATAKARDAVGGTKDSATGRPRAGGLVGFLDDITGGFGIGKAAKYGAAGIVGSFAANTLSDIAGGLVKARDEGGGYEAYARGVAKALPVVSGLVDLQDNLVELWTGANAEVEKFNRSQEASLHLARVRKSLLDDERKADRDFRDRMSNRLGNEQADSVGGRIGRVAAIDEQRQQDIRARRAQLDDALKANERDRKQAIDDQAKILRRDPRSGRVSEGTRSQYEANVGLINNRFDQTAEGLRERYEAENRIIDRVADRRIDIAKGIAADTAGIGDRISELDKQIRTMDGDPIAQLGKEFAELKPGREEMDRFNKTLGLYADRLEQSERQADRYNANKAIDRLLREPDVTGLDRIEQRLAEFSSKGADGERVIKFRLDLEAREANRITAELSDRFAGIDDRIRETRGTTPEDIVGGRIQSEANRLKRENGKSFTADQQAQLYAKELDAFYADQAKANRDAMRSPQEKLEQSRQNIQAQVERGYLTAAEGDRAIANALRDLGGGQRPELLEAGTADLDRALAVASGEVADASDPRLEEAKTQTGLLEEVRDYLRNQNERGGVFVRRRP